MSISLKRKKIFQQEKRNSFVFRNAFQISRKKFSCHIHSHIYNHCSHAHFLLFFAISGLTPVPKVCLSRSFLCLILHIFHIIITILWCSGMFQNVPCSMFHVPDFIDGQSNRRKCGPRGYSFKCKFCHALCVWQLLVNRNA